MSRTTIRDLREAYRAGDPLTMLTAYDAPIAAAVDRAGVDLILVGDSAAHNHMGHESTLPLTVDDAVENAAAVVRGTESAMVVADLPFGSYGAAVESSVDTAVRFCKEAGADAVKLETAPDGGITVDVVDRCTELGIPVQGHLGLTPQRINQIGGPVIQGREGPDSAFADDLVETASDLVDAGIFSLVLEGLTEGVARRVTEAVDVPTIGIGAGRYTDGQVLVITDLLGLSASDYRLSEQYADLDATIEAAVEQFLADVEDGEFPARENVYEPIDGE